MSVPNQARVEFGTAGSNIASNIDVLLPQLADRGAEVAKAGNQIHEELLKLRQISKDYRTSSDDTIQETEFDKCAESIERLLPQLSGHGAEVDSVASAIKGYCNQLHTLHAQHLHLVDESAPVVPGMPLVNNGVGSGPFNTGIAAAVEGKEINIDPLPKPAGSGQPLHAVASDEPGKAELV